MKKRLVFLSLSVAALVVALQTSRTFVAAAPSGLQSPVLQKPAPAFTLLDTNGKSHSLADYQGKTVILEWYNPGCPFVKKHYDTGNMQKLQKRSDTKADVVWLSIVSSAAGKQGNMSPAAHNEQIKEWGGHADALLIDENGAVGRAYGAQTTPHMFVINAEGLLAYKGAIDDKPTVKKADVATAKNYVTLALDALQGGSAITVASTTPYGCSVKY